ncbi:MAG: pyridoxamine 5'-phosphate oxidase family protein [Erysipelotrichales bacterium]|nr:pyridoxamine 5'-phosphate oxidase family protein [Erysipelotrichales bacterium]
MKKMRRFKQQLSQEKNIEILKRNTSGVLSLLDNEGYTYALPISYVYHNNHLYFHCAKTGHKIEAIQYHNKVSFCVIDKDQIVSDEYTTYFRSVIAFGTISIIENHQTKKEALKYLIEKYCINDTKNYLENLDNHITGLHMLDLNIDKISGKEAIELVKEK